MTAITIPSGPEATDDPNACTACGGRLLTSEVEVACSDCGIVVDAAPIVNAPVFGTAASSAPIPMIRPTTLPFGGGLVGHHLRRVEQHTTSRVASRDSRRARQWATTARVVNQLGLSPAFCDEATAILQRVNLSGRPTEEMAAAAAIVVARKHGISLGVREVALAVGIRWSRMGRALRDLKRADPSSRVMPLAPSAVVVRIAERLQRPLPVDVRRWCVDVGRILDGLRLSSSPQVTAVVPFEAVRRARRDFRLTQAQIAAAASVTEVSIRVTAKDTIKRVGHLFPPVPTAPLRILAPVVLPVVRAAPLPRNRIARSPTAPRPDVGGCVVCDVQIDGDPVPTVVIVNYHDAHGRRGAIRPTGHRIHRACAVVAKPVDGTRCVACSEPTVGKNGASSVRLFARAPRQIGLALRIHKACLHLDGFSYVDGDGAPLSRARVVPES